MKMRIQVITTILLTLGLGIMTAEGALPIGSTAPGFSLPGVDGAFHGLDDLKGTRATVVVFTCNHCPFAKAYEDRLVELQSRYNDQGVRFIAINPNDAESHPQDNYASMKQRSDEKGFNFPYLRDRTQLAAAAYGAEVTPHIFLFDGDLKLQYEGRIDDNWQDSDKVTSPDLANAIEALIAGKAVSSPTTNPRGCSIKWARPGQSPATPFSIAASPTTIEPLAVGQQLPNALVADMEGRVVWLRDELNDAKTALIVFRGGWCPYCMRHLGGLREIVETLKERDYRILAISPDTPEGTQKGTQPLELGYRLLADIGMEAIIAMGLAFELDDATVEKYHEYKIPLRSPPGSSASVLPVPAVYLLDAAGQVTFAHSDPDYKVRLDSEALLKATE